MKKMSTSADRKLWSKDMHESRVERFYGVGVEKYDNWHNGYLNFGLWEDGIKDYIAAAENLVRRMGTILGLNQESRLLDVACGMGTQDIHLYRTFQPQSIDAVDVTWKNVEHGLRRAREAKIEDRVRFHHGTATQLPFPANNFTHVMSIEGPEHFNTREKFFQDAHRVLVPGGKIAIADYSLKRPPRGMIEKVVVEAARALWQVPKENVYSAEVFEEKLLKNGYKNVTVQEVGALTIPGYYFEQRRPEVAREMAKIRGFVAGRLGIIIDIAVYKAFTMGLMEYVLVSAEKK
jgi:ubiquinone/menaquinone biosynthesis C-methylase UbiE